MKLIASAFVASALAFTASAAQAGGWGSGSLITVSPVVGVGNGAGNGVLNGSSVLSGNNVSNILNGNAVGILNGNSTAVGVGNGILSDFGVSGIGLNILNGGKKH